MGDHSLQKAQGSTQRRKALKALGLDGDFASSREPFTHKEPRTKNQEPSPPHNLPFAIPTPQFTVIQKTTLGLATDPQTMRHHSLQKAQGSTQRRKALKALGIDGDFASLRLCVSHTLPNMASDCLPRSLEKPLKRWNEDLLQHRIFTPSHHFLKIC